MSDKNDGPGDRRPGYGQRFVSKAEQDQQEIQDWLNGNGLIVVGLISLFIIGFGIYALMS